MKVSSNHLPSLLSSILFLLAGMLLFGIAALMGFVALVSFVMGADANAQQTIFMLTFGFEALVLLAAAFYVFQRYLQKPAAEREVSVVFSVGHALLGLLIAAAALAAGYLIGTTQALQWAILPILTVPAIVLPLGALLALGAQRLPLGRRWESWAVLGLAMTLGPLILFTLEIALAILIFVGVVAYVVVQPELLSQLQAVSEQLLILGPESEQALVLLAPYLTAPSVIAVVLLYIAILVPAIEELIKPIGVWLFARQFRTTAQGFALGALSGAGYALIETIGVSGQQTGDWASLLISRIGTGLLHITTSALMGAAIVRAVRERRYVRLLCTYLLAAGLHGAWNALAIFFTFSTLADVSEQPGWLGTVQPVLLIAMIALAFGIFAILILSNRRQRREMQTPLPDPSMVREDPGASAPM